MQYRPDLIRNIILELLRIDEKIQLSLCMCKITPVIYIEIDRHDPHGRDLRDMFVQQHIGHVRYLRIMPDDKDRVTFFFLHQKDLPERLRIGKVKFLKVIYTSLIFKLPG